MFDFVDKYNVTVNRVSITLGIMRYLDSEIKDMLSLARDHGTEAMMMVGPRAKYDIGAQAHINTLNAQMVAYRLRGTDQLVHGIEDALRAIELGCRGIIACDEGLLYILNEMRKDGTIPKNMKFKGSVLLGTTNFVRLRLLAKMGAGSVNIQRDMPITMIGGFRLGSACPIVVHANNPGQTGGFVRTYDVPQIVRIAAPVYIKTGNIAVPLHSMMVDDNAGYRMGREVVMTSEIIKKHYPEAVQTKKGDKDLAIPEL
ncbi:MAG: hypothetical protein MUO21_09290 [Nitrososphaeraceae archaeon]|nr:hypothetical protein [Nitrososphaeraceae archaeon]